MLHGKYALKIVFKRKGVHQILMKYHTRSREMLKTNAIVTEGPLAVLLSAFASLFNQRVNQIASEVYVVSESFYLSNAFANGRSFLATCFFCAISCVGRTDGMLS